MEMMEWDRLCRCGKWNEAHSLAGELKREGRFDVARRDSEGNTPLHLACLTGAADHLIKWLIDAGSDLKAQNHTGLVPWDLIEKGGDSRSKIRCKRLKDLFVRERRSRTENQSTNSSQAAPARNKESPAASPSAAPSEYRYAPFALPIGVPAVQTPSEVDEGGCTRHLDTHRKSPREYLDSKLEEYPPQIAQIQAEVQGLQQPISAPENGLQPFPPKRKIALLIGNQTHTPATYSLKCPKRDVTNLGHLLRNKFGFDHVQVCIDLPACSFRNEAGGEYRNMRHFVQLWLDSEIKEDDLVIFVFSGHGFSSPEGVSWLQPSGLMPGAERRAYVTSTQLRNCFEAHNNIFWIALLDCCRRPGEHVARDVRAMGPDDQLSTNDAHGLMIFSCNEDSAAFEDEGGSFFMRTVTDVLNMPNHDHYFARALFREAGRRLLLDGRQHPHISQRLEPERDVDLLGSFSARNSRRFVRGFFDVFEYKAS